MSARVQASQVVVCCLLYVADVAGRHPRCTTELCELEDKVTEFFYKKDEFCWLFARLTKIFTSVHPSKCKCHRDISHACQRLSAYVPRNRGGSKRIMERWQTPRVALPIPSCGVALQSNVTIAAVIVKGNTLVVYRMLTNLLRDVAVNHANQVTDCEDLVAVNVKFDVIIIVGNLVNHHCNLLHVGNAIPIGVAWIG